MKRLLFFLLFISIAISVNAQTTFATADTMSVGVLKAGMVNGTAAQHYYKTALPANVGAFRLITSTSNGGSVFGIVQYRVFWKNQNTINYYNVSRNPSTSGADTFVVGPLQADSLYILVDNVYSVMLWDAPLVIPYYSYVRGPVVPGHQVSAHQTVTGPRRR